MRSLNCKRLIPSLVSTLSLLLPALHSEKLFAWGAVAHEIINAVAAESMTSADKDFFLANRDNLVKFATVPDRSWKQGASREEEAPLHFMDWDNYVATPLGAVMPASLETAQKLVGRDFIKQKGGGVWRVGQMYSLLVAAVQKGDCSRIIQVAGVLGHYVGDMSMPMHFSSNYDGQSINRKGVHAYFETILVGKQDRGELHDKVSQASASAASTDLLSQGDTPDTTQSAVALAFNEGKQAVASLDRILAIFKESKDTQGYNDDELAAFLPRLMGLGSASLAQLLDKAEIDAGKSSGCPAQAINVGEPAWIPLQ